MAVTVSGAEIVAAVGGSRSRDKSVHAAFVIADGVFLFSTLLFVPLYFTVPVYML